MAAVPHVLSIVREQRSQLNGILMLDFCPLLVIFHSCKILAISRSSVRLDELTARLEMTTIHVNVSQNRLAGQFKELYFQILRRLDLAFPVLLFKQLLSNGTSIVL